jgi:hypothetical protein
MNIRLSALLPIVLFALGISTPAGADVGVSVEFSKDEIRIISAWYRDNDERARGRGRNKGLPPGIARNLAEGKALPPGIAKQHLPSALIAQLPPVPRGYERVVVDGKVLLVEVATQVVHDILTDVILR